MAIVEFTKDCYPYCKGDKIEVSEEERKDLDALAEKREVPKPYKVVEDVKVPKATDTIEAVETTEGERVNDVVSQEAADANLTAPGVEERQAVEAEREAKVVEKKSKAKK